VSMVEGCECIFMRSISFYSKKNTYTVVDATTTTKLFGIRKQKNILQHFFYLEIFSPDSRLMVKSFAIFNGT